jgi:hypothetical protein
MNELIDRFLCFVWLHKYSPWRQADNHMKQVANCERCNNEKQRYIWGK